MKNISLKKSVIALTLSAMMAATLAGCGTVAQKITGTWNASASSEAPSSQAASSSAETAASREDSGVEIQEIASSTVTAPEQEQEDGGVTAQEAGAVTTVQAAGGILDGTELFTDRDLAQTADLSQAVTYDVSQGDLTVTQAGVYVLTGTAENVTVTVNAGDEDKVQLVLDGVTVTNDDFPVIYVKNADKVFVTTAAGSENTLAVTGSFTKDGDTNTDGVIFSKDDLVLNGLGTLTITSTDNAVVGKDDLKITGGAYVINAASKAFEANDSIRIAGGVFDLTAGTDALHAENDDDDTLGYIYICGGDFSIDVGDDGIHGTSIVQIDGGSFTISAAEGIEGTVIQINGGTIDIQSWDDGINAARKSSAYSPVVEINGGEITIAMSAGDTDGVDSNGDIIINGGVISVTGNSTFDYDGSAQVNGGTVYVNGQQVSSLPNQMMGGGMGGFGGGRGGRR